MAFKPTLIASLLFCPVIASAGMVDTAKADIRREREAAVIDSLRKEYSPEIAKYKANPDRAGTKCYLTASEKWSMWSGLPKAAFEACDEVVRQEIKSIRDSESNAIAAAKAERAEKRKSMSEITAKLDEIDERQQDRERDMDRREATRQANADADAAAKAQVDAADSKLKGAKRLSCSLGNAKDC